MKQTIDKIKQAILDSESEGVIITDIKIDVHTIPKNKDKEIITNVGVTITCK